MQLLGVETRVRVSRQIGNEASKSRAASNLLSLKCLRLAVGIAYLTAGVSFAQTNRGTISGTVTDPSGAPVAGASVTAQELSTGTTYTATASGSGNYNFPQVAIGTYNLTTTAGGFRTDKRTGIVVQINSTAVANIQLSLGQQAETVTVVADAPTVESTTSDVGVVVSPQQVQQLPLSLGGVGAFRSPEAFEFLVPGVVGPGTGNNSNGIYIQKTSGGENFGDDVILDGASAARPDNNSTFDETAPSVEALREFRVETATPPAQFGRTTGGVRSFTTNSGTNSFHGAAFDILRNTDLDANTYFNNLGKTTCAPGDQACFGRYAVPKDIKNDYGVSLGGPVIIPHLYNGRDRTFFFFSWEQLKWPRSSTSTTTLPTTAETQGDFSQILTSNVIGTNPCTGAPVYAGEIFDPRSATTSANGTPCRATPMSYNGRLNVIPPSLLNPVALKVLSYVPAPNLPGLQNNFSFAQSFPTENTTYTIRVDHNLGNSDKLFASYDARENTLLTGGSPILPYPIDPNTWNQDFTTHYGRVGWDHIFGPTVLNHLNLAFDRWNSANETPAATSGTNWAATLGLGNVYGAAFPQFNVGSGFPAFGQARADDTISNLAEPSDLFTINKGRHTITIGGDYRWIQLNNLTQDNASGNYNFSPAETAAGSGILASQGGFSFASFLTGQVDSANLTVFAHYPRFTQKYYALFAQDNFTVTPHLTLNLGVRWSVEIPRTEGQNYTSNFDPAVPNPGAGGRPGALVFASSCSGCNTQWAKTFYDDVGPRIGMAWSPGNSGKTAIRAAYSIVYGPLFYSDFGNSMNAGYTASPNPVSPNGFSPAFNLAGGFPAYSAAPILDPTIRNGQSVDYITPGFGKPPMVNSWSLQIQQQLATDLILSVGYVGNKAQNLRSAAAVGMYNNFPLQDLGLGQNVLNANVGSAVANSAGVFAPFPGFNGSVGNALRHYPQYMRFNTDCCLENDGMSDFEALEVMLQRRFHAGLNVQLSYTWSKTESDADSLLPGQNAGGGVYQDPYNLYLEKSISSQDIPQNFVGSFIYELPFGKGRHFMNQGILGSVLGGWNIGAILRYESGQPLPFYCASGVSGWDDCFRFNPVPGQSVYNPAINQPGFNPLTTPYLNNNYFADPNPNPNAPIVFGQLARVTGFRMQAFQNEDVSVAKRFHFTENAFVELRADAFNIANRHIFGQPGNLNPSPNNPSTNFGFIGGTIDSPRNVQVEARFQF